MEEKSVVEMHKDPVPYIVYEYTMARFERTIKRLIFVIIVAVVTLFASNMAWLYAWNLYDYEDTQIIVDGESKGNANYIGASGVINNGEGGSKEESPAKK
jgi:hypothetical protein